MPDELLVLGSASADPTRRRFPSAYALNVTGKLFLIDCGAPVSTLLPYYKLNPIDVQAVFLSHWHMDHVANLGLLLTQNHLRQRLNTLKVYGPKGSRGKIRRLLADSFVRSKELSYKLKVTNIKASQTYKEALLRVTYFKTQHLEQPELQTHFGPHAIACGMVLNGPGWRVVYSGDLHSPTELSLHVKGCQLLIHELAHHRPETVAKFAEAKKIPHLLISHIDPKFDEAPEKIVAAFNKHYSGNLIIAQDGLRVPLNELRQKSSPTIQAAGKNSRQHGETDPAQINQNYWRSRESSLGFSQKMKDQYLLPTRTQTDILAKPDLEKPTKLTEDSDTSAWVSHEGSPNATFFYILQEKFELSPAISHQILQVAKEVLIGQSSSSRQLGQVGVVVANLYAPSNVPLTQADRIEVTLTIDAGVEDTEVEISEGVTGLRRGRILRLLAEAIEQEGVLTQEDLAWILNVNVRTIRRDIHILKQEDHEIYTRGQLKTEGNIQLYQAKAIEMWLAEKTAPDIARWLHHSDRSVERHIDLFLEIVVLQQQGQNPKEISTQTQTRPHLVQNYLAVYKRAQSKAHWKKKLQQELISRQESNSPYKDNKENENLESQS